MTPKDLFERIRRIEIKTSRVVEDFLQGMYRSVFKGKGIEFEEVRPFESGDDIRTVDWNVTARTGYPHIKMFKEEREITVMLVIDISASLYYGTVEQLKKDLIAEVAAVLAFSAIKNHDKVGLLLFTEEIEKYIPPRKGKRDVLRIIRDLLVFEPKGRGTNIKQALAFLGSVQRKKAISFVFSDFISSTNYEKELNLAAKHYDLIAVNVVDPRENHFPDLGMVSLKDRETGYQTLVNSSQEQMHDLLSQAFAVRKSAITAMTSKYNAGYIELWTDQPYIAPLRKYFEMRRRRIQK